MLLRLRHRCGIGMRFGASAVAMALAACSTTQVPRMSVTEANAQLHQGYLLAAGDKLKVTVFDEPNLTGEYQVGARGDVALPLIDAIPAEGSSPEDLAERIAAALAEGGYVLDPRVAVEVM